MSTDNLVQESLKLKSLPKELRNLAQEVIDEKFGMEEEVKPKEAASFRPEGDYRYHEGLDFSEEGIHGGPSQVTEEVYRRTAHGWVRNEPESDVRHQGAYRDGRGRGEYEIKTTLDLLTLRRKARSRIFGATTRSIRDALSILDYNKCRRDRRKIVASQNFYRHLSMDEGFPMFFARDNDRERGYAEESIGMLFCCRMVVAPEGTEAYIEAEY